MKCHNNGEIESTHQDTSKGKSYYRPHSLLVDISLSSQLKIKNKYNTSQKKLDSFIVKIQNILVNHNKNPDDFGKMITGLKCKVDVLFKHDIEKRIYSYCVSLKTNPSEIKNEVVLFLNDFQKQIDIGWNEKHGVKSTSQIYLLNFISLALLMHLYITVSDILDDVRLLNSACKIFDNIYSYETNKIKDLELSFICVALLEQSRSLGSLRRKIVV